MARARTDRRGVRGVVGAHGRGSPVARGPVVPSREVAWGRNEYPVSVVIESRGGNGPANLALREVLSGYEHHRHPPIGCARLTGKGARSIGRLLPFGAGGHHADAWARTI